MGYVNALVAWTLALLAVVIYALMPRVQVQIITQGTQPLRWLNLSHDEPIKTFRNFSTVALSHEPITDKVTVHGYGPFYDAYFTRNVIDQPIKLLEIGLGCGMGYGPGASSRIWPELFPKGEVWFAEFDEACIKRYWNASMPWRYVTGDQSDVPTLKSWVQTTGGGFDYIIDDGGHTNPQIWNAFQVLFHAALKPGGTYFIEDLHVGRANDWYKGGIPGGNGTVVLDAIADWMDQLVIESERGSLNAAPAKPFYQHALPEHIARIDCVRDMCAITKLK